MNAQAQQTGVVPLEEYYNYKTDDNLKHSDVTYFKDINNHLDKFVGTWTGSYDNKTLTLKISILNQKVGYRIAYDELLIKYKIEENNTNVLINTLDMFDEYQYHINGKFFGETTTRYYANYTGLEWECNQTGTAFIDYINSSTSTFWILPDSDMIGPECPLANIHILPTTKATEVTLTKQN
jgi:hypothetical protein